MKPSEALIRERAQSDHQALLAGLDLVLDVLAGVREEINAHAGRPHITTLHLGYLRGSGTVASGIYRALHTALGMPAEPASEGLLELLEQPTAGMVELAHVLRQDEGLLELLEQISDLRAVEPPQAAPRPSPWAAAESTREPRGHPPSGPDEGPTNR